MRGLVCALLLLTVAPLLAEAPPVEFGLEEFRQAVAERGLGNVRINTEISTGKPETYRITSYRVIQGGDLRGLMYGLLAAADQIRRLGRLVPESGTPAVPLRGIRRFLHNADLEARWYYSEDYWRDYFRMLARNRFNRLNLVFAHQTNYLAPPYPYWVEVEDYPEIRVPGLTADQRQRNLDTLCMIAQTASDHAVDFTLGIWQHDFQEGRQERIVDGITAENVGPYSYQALKKVLAACPAIRGIQIRTNWESGIPSERQVSFYRDYVYKALRETGRRVTLNLRGWLMSEGMLRAATDSGVPMRLSSKYWAEHLGRPYQPAEIYPNYSYIDFLRRYPDLNNDRVRPYDFYWEIWALGSHRMLLWGDPGYVSRTAATLSLSDSIGFEIDEPQAQKGYGNRPGTWGVFTPTQQRRHFWGHDFERYWLFYTLWGRLTYDPEVPARVWGNEFERRYGGAAEAAEEAYRKASAVLNEVVTVHMPDPNMYMWPEINPGGLIDYYAATPASSRRYVASIAEAVRDRLEGRASAKQRPVDTAAKLREMADEIDQAVAAVDEAIEEPHAEWSSTKPDFQVLALLARSHAHRQVAAERLLSFYATADRDALTAARSEIEAGLAVWRELVKLTDGLYPPNMAYGPEDFGHWKDKLPYLEHDLATIDAREWLLDRFGRFAHGFDFGAAPGELRYLTRIHTSVEPRFKPVAPNTEYDEETGFGWVGEGERTAAGMEEVPRGILRATTHNPTTFPENALFGDSIRGAGAQTFRVRTGDGTFRAMLLTPDGNATSQTIDAVNEHIDVVLPDDEWDLSGLIVKSAEPSEPVGIDWPERPERPTISHRVPTVVRAGSPLSVRLQVSPPGAAAGVRLHYRPLNAREEFRTLEADGGSATFEIPGDELNSEWDLLYYFEVLAENGTGWFHPDPEEQTPYYVVKVDEPAQ